MQEFLWCSFGLVLIYTCIDKWASLDKVPVQFVILFCTMFICGTICGIKEK